MVPMETARRRVRGRLHDVAPAAFVQMIANERETCALVVREDGREGTLFFVSGELWDARLGAWTGEEAAVRLLGWDLADVETLSLGEPPDRAIEAPLTFILLESMRLRDEDARDGEPDTSGGHVPVLGGLFRDLEGVSGACLIDLSSGRSLEEHFEAAPGLDSGEVVRACHALARAGAAVAASALEEIVLTWADRLVLLRFLGADVLLAVIADPSRLRLPALHAALRKLALPRPQGLWPWQE